MIRQVGQKQDYFDLAGKKPLAVAIVDGAGNQVTSFGGSGGTSSTDESAFTPGSTAGTPIMAAGDETTPDSVTEGQIGIVRMTLPRALHVNLRDASGNEVAVGGGTQYDEDTAAVAAEKVTMAGVVRRDTPSSLVDANGDRTELIVDANGRLHVLEPSGATIVGHVDGIESLLVTIDGDTGVLAGAISTAGAATPSTGNLAHGSDGTNARALKTDVGGELQIDVLTLPALVAGTANIGDVDVLTVPAPLSTTGGGTEAAALRVTIASDSTGVVSVDDNGSSLTVDGTVAVTNAGTFPVQESGAALTALQLIDDAVHVDDTATHATGTTKGMLLMAAATPTDAAVDANDLGAVAMTVNRELHVSLTTALPAGTAAIGKLAANSGVDIGDVDVTTVGTITPGTAATSLGKAEDGGHTTGDVGVFALGVRNDTPNTALTNADADYSPISVNKLGSVRMAPPEDDFAVAGSNHVKKYYTSTGAVTDGIIWSPAAGKRWYITSIFINVSAAATVTLEDDKSGGDEVIWKAELAANSGWSSTFPVPWFSGEDAADLIITTNTGNVYVSLVGYEI